SRPARSDAHRVPRSPAARAGRRRAAAPAPRACGGGAPAPPRPASRPGPATPPPPPAAAPPATAAARSAAPAEPARPGRSGSRSPGPPTRARAARSRRSGAVVRRSAGPAERTARPAAEPFSMPGCTSRGVRPQAGSMSLSVGQVARLAGVTVRTLHHDDEIGLLIPGERTRAGYRRYTDEDLARLQQILLYRGLGFPRVEIAANLDDPAADVLSQPRRQHAALTREAGRLREVIAAVERAIE